jgi:hypothetical protein
MQMLGAKREDGKILKAKTVVLVLEWRDDDDDDDDGDGDGDGDDEIDYVGESWSSVGGWIRFVSCLGCLLDQRPRTAFDASRGQRVRAIKRLFCKKRIPVPLSDPVCPLPQMEINKAYGGERKRQGLEATNRLYETSRNGARVIGGF